MNNSSCLPPRYARPTRCTDTRSMLGQALPQLSCPSAPVADDIPRRSSGRPLYPVAPLDGDEVAYPARPVRFAGFPFVRTVAGEWQLVIDDG